MIDWLTASHADLCNTSCPDCLRSYSNLAYHNLLDWRLGMDMASLALDPLSPPVGDVAAVAACGRSAGATLEEPGPATGAPPSPACRGYRWHRSHHSDPSLVANEPARNAAPSWLPPVPMRLDAVCRLISRAVLLRFLKP